MTNLVQAEVTRTRLTFIPRPDGEGEPDGANPDSEFDVLVTNHSDQFASFQLELSAAGVNPSSGLKWYRVEPRISTKKPPGQTTQFHVRVTKAPVPAYDTTIDLTLKVFSVESTKLAVEETLSLKIEKPRRSFKIDLPVDQLMVIPGEQIRIPILVYNLTPKHSNITLTLSSVEPESSSDQEVLQSSDDPEQLPSLDPDWFSPRIGQTVEQTIPIDAGESVKVFFECKPPADIKTLSYAYPFQIEARSDTSTYRNRQNGMITVLLWGEVMWGCLDPIQTIPARQFQKRQFQKGRWHRGDNLAVYALNFDNQTNAPQSVQLRVTEEQELLLPQLLMLEPGEAQQMNVEVRKRRPRIGLTRKLLFNVSPELLDAFGQKNSVPVKPPARVFELLIKPLIPVWLQFLLLLLILLLLWLAYWLYCPSMHQESVNSIQLVGTGGTVVSASSDRTLRRWQVNNNFFLPMSRLKDEGVIADVNQVQQPIQVIRAIPDHEDQVALGLEDGSIQLWDVLQNQLIPTFAVQEKNDRVFALDFTQDSRNLFSGHGSGRIYQWDAGTGQPIGDGAYPRFAISALRVSESQKEDGLDLAIAGGRYNKLVFWDWRQNRLFELPYADLSQAFLSSTDLSQMPQFAPIVGQYDYIESLDVTQNGKFLATGDSRGYVSLWDMQKIRTCILQQPTGNPADRRAITDRLKNRPNRLYRLSNCSNVLLNQWMGGSGQSVRAVAFSQNGCYLASGGDDQRVMLWQVSEMLDRSKPPCPPADRGRNLTTLSWMRLIRPARINSVDIKALNDRVLVVAGDDRHRVRLFRVNSESNHANCQ